MKALLVVALALIPFGEGGGPRIGAPRARPVTTRYDAYFRKYSKHYFGVTFDWRLFKAQAMAESGLSPKALSDAGARGIMQLMPSTFATIQSSKPHYESIDDPQWNIAAGIVHDRGLWTVFKDRSVEDDRPRFMFGAYNAGDITIVRAQSVAKRAQLDPAEWPSVETVAPRVPRWRYKETLGYVRTIERNYTALRPGEGAAAP